MAAKGMQVPDWFKVGRVFRVRGITEQDRYGEFVELQWVDRGRGSATVKIVDWAAGDKVHWVVLWKGRFEVRHEGRGQGDWLKVV
jgi:hypothetical protein